MRNSCQKKLLLFRTIFDIYTIRCGVCVGGNSGLSATAGINSCGSCVTPGTEDSEDGPCGCGTEQMDQCGECRNRTSPQWNRKRLC